MLGEIATKCIDLCCTTYYLNFKSIIMIMILTIENKQIVSLLNTNTRTDKRVYGFVYFITYTHLYSCEVQH